MPDPTDITLTTDDAHALAATWFPPEHGTPHTLLLISSGTGIPRQFYRRFAAFAASRGFGVLTYDYRGIGGSAPASLRNTSIRYREWGQHDMPAALAWLRTRVPDVPLAVVGHSAGGQQLGLAHNVHLVDAALFVAVSTGYWRDMPTKHRWFTWALWNLFVPVMRAALGYFPARRFGLGEDLPGPVATEWGAWCQEPTYMAAFFDGTGHARSPDGEDFGAVHFDRAQLPIHWLCFDDDPIANPRTVPPLMQLYGQANIESQWVSPRELGVDTIGHLGFFRESLGASLWPGTLDALRSKAAHSVAEPARAVTV